MAWHLANAAADRSGQLSRRAQGRPGDAGARADVACVLGLSAGSHEWIGLDAFAAVFLEA